MNKEPQAQYDEAAGNYGRGMADWEAGRISPSELGQLKRRMNRAELKLRAARLADELSAQVSH